MPSTAWFTALVFVMPFVAFIGVTASVMISSRVGDERSAQQLSGLVVLPVIGLSVLNFTGLVIINTALVLGVALGLAVISYVMFRIAVGIFSREKIITT